MQSVAKFYSVLQVLQGVAVCCSVLQCVAVCCSVLQCVAECCRASNVTCQQVEGHRPIEYAHAHMCYACERVCIHENLFMYVCI